MCFSYIIFIEIINANSGYTFFFYNWILIENIYIDISFLIDSLSVSMLLIITTVSFIAHVYSIEYMQYDAQYTRYFSLLSMFTFCMIVLVSSENLLQLFIGWEGVGICSYLLINFWYTRFQANKSSILAISANKVGDLALLSGCIVVHFTFNTLSFSILQTITAKEPILTDFIQPYYTYAEDACTYIDHHGKLAEKMDFWNVNIEYLNSYFLEIATLFEVIGFFLVIACIGKSAQFGFHIWLPEAMEGPTPVSSLIHAATMVTAGVFVLLRFSWLFIDTYYSTLVLILIGTVTLFFSATIGITNLDIKKVIAYSTCSQLGLLFLSCGFHGFTYSFFHLVTHAFFKALLFLTAGYVIHLVSDEQDIRKMGGLLKILPVSYISMLIGSYSIIGFPFLSGFFSKELLLDYVYTHIQNAYMLNNSTIYYCLLLFLSVALFTTLLYSLKTIFLVFFTEFYGYKYYIKSIKYSNFFVHYALTFLIVYSIFSGIIISDLFVGVNSDFLTNALYTKNSFTYSYVTELNTSYTSLVLLVLMHYIYVFYILNFVYKDLFLILLTSNFLIYTYTILLLKYVYYNYMYLNMFTKYVNMIHTIHYAQLEKGFIDFVGPYSIVSFFKYYKLSVLFTERVSIVQNLLILFIALVLL